MCKRDIRDTICVVRKPSRWDFLAPVLCFLEFLLTGWLDQNVNSSTNMQNTQSHHGSQQSVSRFRFLQYLAHITSERLHFLTCDWSKHWVIFESTKRKILGKIWIWIFYPNPPWQGVLKNQNFQKLLNIICRTYKETTKSRRWTLYLKNWASYSDFRGSRYDKISLSQNFQISYLVEFLR